MNYWNNLDKDLEIQMDVLDDFVGEAKEVEIYNKWITYGTVRRIRFVYKCYRLLQVPFCLYLSMKTNDFKYTVRTSYKYSHIQYAQYIQTKILLHTYVHTYIHVNSRYIHTNMAYIS